MIAQLEPLNRIVGTENISAHILPAIKNLTEDKQWRNRLSIIEKIPSLSETFVFFVRFSFLFFSLISFASFLKINKIRIYIFKIINSIDFLFIFCLSILLGCWFYQRKHRSTLHRETRRHRFCCPRSGVKNDCWADKVVRSWMGKTANFPTFVFVENKSELSASDDDTFHSQ